MRYTLIVDPLCKKNVTYPHTDGSTVVQIPALTLTQLPLAQLNGVELHKLVIYAGTEIQPEALNWVLSRLRDVKDDPSGIGT